LLSKFKTVFLTAKVTKEVLKKIKDQKR